MRNSPPPSQCSQRSPQAPRPGTPAGLGAKKDRTGRGGWPSSLQRLGPTAREDAPEEPRAEMLASRRGTLGESPPVQSPRGRKSRPGFGQSDPGGQRSGAWEWGGVERRLFSPLPKLSQHTSQPVLLRRNEAPQKAQRTHLPARRSAPVSPAGSQTLRTACPAPRLLPEQGSLMSAGRARPPVPGSAALALPPRQLQARL